MNYNLPAPIVLQDFPSTVDSLSLRVYQGTGLVRSRLYHCPTVTAKYNMPLITRHDKFSRIAAKSLHNRPWVCPLDFQAPDSKSSPDFHSAKAIRSTTRPLARPSPYGKLNPHPLTVIATRNWRRCGRSVGATVRSVFRALVRLSFELPVFDSVAVRTQAPQILELSLTVRGPQAQRQSVMYFDARLTPLGTIGILNRTGFSGHRCC